MDEKKEGPSMANNNILESINRSPASKKLKKQQTTKKTLKNIMVYAMLILLGLLFAYPFLWFLSVAIKNNENIYTLNIFSS